MVHERNVIKSFGFGVYLLEITPPRVLKKQETEEFVRSLNFKNLQSSILKDNRFYFMVNEGHEPSKYECRLMNECLEELKRLDLEPQFKYRCDLIKDKYNKLMKGID